MLKARAIIFDIRRVEANNPVFISSAEALYETALLAHAAPLKGFAYLSLILVGVKGFEYLLNMHSLKEIDPAFKRAFGKLKQLMKISSQNAIYSDRKTMEAILEELVSQFMAKIGNMEASTMDIVVISATEKQRIKSELESFLGNTYVKLNKLLVVHVSSPEILNCVDVNEKLKWTMIDNNEEIKTLFKSWLTTRRKNWKLEMVDPDDRCEWSTQVDIEDLVYDLNGWPSRNSFDFSDTSRLGVFNEVSEERIQIVKWVLNDAVQSWLISGLPRRLSPAKDGFPDKDAYETNREEFCSLSTWLMNESVFAIARLVPHHKVIDYFIISPGSDGSLLMRNLAPRELILPPSSNCMAIDDNEDISTILQKQVCLEEIRSAYLKLPTYDSSKNDSSSLVNALESYALNAKEAATTTSKPKAAPRSRKNRCLSVPSVL